MSTVLEQVKSAAYTSVGVNLLVTDAIVGHEVSTPDFIQEHTTLARKHATDALTDFRAYTEPRATKIAEQLPEQLGDAMTTSRTRAWDFIGIDAPKPSKKTTKNAEEAEVVADEA
jgi:hypothetical protein